MKQHSFMRIATKRLWKRLVALLTCFFYMNTAVFADISVPTASHPINSHPSVNIDSKLDLAFPHSNGEVLNVFNGKSDQFVVHIQDAHINQEAQKNISKIIQYFYKKRGARVVGVEGVDGEVAHQLLSSYPSAKTRKLVADNLLEDATITGPENSAMIIGKDLRITGLEKSEIYEANRQAFFKTMAIQATALPKVIELKKALMDLSRHALTSEAYGILKAKQTFQLNAEDSLLGYLQVLKKSAEKLNLSTSGMGLEALLQISLKDKDLDSAQMQKKLDRWMIQRSNKNSGEDIAEKIIQFRMGQLSKKDLYFSLLGYLSSKEINADELEIKAYLDFAVKVEFASENLFEEIDNLEQQIFSRLVQKPAHEKIITQLKAAETLKKLFQLEWTKEDVVFYSRHKKHFTQEAFLELIPIFVQHGFDSGKIPSLKSLDEWRRGVEVFYRLALKRDEIIGKNLLKLIDAHKKSKTIVVVTGGFHTPAIEHYLTNQNISYAVIRPVIKGLIKDEQDKKKYADAMRLNLPKNMEKLLKLQKRQQNVDLQDPRFQLGVPTKFPTVEFLRLNQPDGVVLDPRLVFVLYTAFMLHLVGTRLLGKLPEPKRFENLLLEGLRPELKPWVLGFFEKLPDGVMTGNSKAGQLSANNSWGNWRGTWRKTPSARNNRIRTGSGVEQTFTIGDFGYAFQFAPRAEVRVQDSTRSTGRVPRVETLESREVFSADPIQPPDSQAIVVQVANQNAGVLKVNTQEQPEQLKALPSEAVDAALGGDHDWSDGDILGSDVVNSFFKTPIIYQPAEAYSIDTTEVHKGSLLTHHNLVLNITHVGNNAQKNDAVEVLTQSFDYHGETLTGNKLTIEQGNGLQRQTIFYRSVQYQYEGEKISGFVGEQGTDQRHTHFIKGEYHYDHSGNLSKITVHHGFNREGPFDSINDEIILYEAGEHDHQSVLKIYYPREVNGQVKSAQELIRTNAAPDEIRHITRIDKHNDYIERIDSREIHSFDKHGNVQGTRTINSNFSSGSSSGSSTPRTTSLTTASPRGGGGGSSSGAGGGGGGSSGSGVKLPKGDPLRGELGGNAPAEDYDKNPPSALEEDKELPSNELPTEEVAADEVPANEGELVDGNEFEVDDDVNKKEENPFSNKRTLQANSLPFNPQFQREQQNARENLEALNNFKLWAPFVFMLGAIYNGLVVRNNRKLTQAFTAGDLGFKAAILLVPTLIFAFLGAGILSIVPLGASLAFLLWLETERYEYYKTHVRPHEDESLPQAEEEGNTRQEVRSVINRLFLAAALGLSSLGIGQQAARGQSPILRGNTGAIIEPRDESGKIGFPITSQISGNISMAPEVEKSASAQTSVKVEPGQQLFIISNPEVEQQLRNKEEEIKRFNEVWTYWTGAYHPLMTLEDRKRLKNKPGKGVGNELNEKIEGGYRWGDVVIGVDVIGNQGIPLFLLRHQKEVFGQVLSPGRGKIIFPDGFGSRGSFSPNPNVPLARFVPNSIFSIQMRVPVAKFSKNIQIKVKAADGKYYWGRILKAQSAKIVNENGEPMITLQADIYVQGLNENPEDVIYEFFPVTSGTALTDLNLPEPLHVGLGWGGQFAVVPVASPDIEGNVVFFRDIDTKIPLPEMTWVNNGDVIAYAHTYNRFKIAAAGLQPLKNRAKEFRTLLTKGQSRIPDWVLGDPEFHEMGSKWFMGTDWGEPGFGTLYSHAEGLKLKIEDLEKMAERGRSSAPANGYLINITPNWYRATRPGETIGRILTTRTTIRDVRIPSRIKVRRGDIVGILSPFGGLVLGEIREVDPVTTAGGKNLQDFQLISEIEVHNDGEFAIPEKGLVRVEIYPIQNQPDLKRAYQSAAIARPISASERWNQPFPIAFEGPLVVNPESLLLFPTHKRVNSGTSISPTILTNQILSSQDIHDQNQLMDELLSKYRGEDAVEFEAQLEKLIQNAPDEIGQRALRYFRDEGKIVSLFRLYEKLKEEKGEKFILTSFAKSYLIELIELPRASSKKVSSLDMLELIIQESRQDAAFREDFQQFVFDYFEQDPFGVSPFSIRLLRPTANAHAFWQNHELINQINGLPADSAARYVLVREYMRRVLGPQIKNMDADWVARLAAEKGLNSFLKYEHRVKVFIGTHNARQNDALVLETSPFWVGAKDSVDHRAVDQATASNPFDLSLLSDVSRSLLFNEVSISEYPMLQSKDFEGQVLEIKGLAEKAKFDDLLRILKIKKYRNLHGNLILSLLIDPIDDAHNSKGRMYVAQLYGQTQDEALTRFLEQSDAIKKIIADIGRFQSIPGLDFPEPSTRAIYMKYLAKLHSRASSHPNIKRNISNEQLLRLMMSLVISDFELSGFINKDSTDVGFQYLSPYVSEEELATAALTELDRRNYLLMIRLVEDSFALRGSGSVTVVGDIATFMEEFRIYAANILDYDPDQANRFWQDRFEKDRSEILPSSNKLAIQQEVKLHRDAVIAGRHEEYRIDSLNYIYYFIMIVAGLIGLTFAYNYIRAYVYIPFFTKQPRLTPSGASAEELLTHANDPHPLLTDDGPDNIIRNEVRSAVSSSELNDLTNSIKIIARRTAELNKEYAHLDVTDHVTGTLHIIRRIIQDERIRFRPEFVRNIHAAREAGYPEWDLSKRSELLHMLLANIKDYQEALMAHIERIRTAKSRDDISYLEEVELLNNLETINKIGMAQLYFRHAYSTAIALKEISKHQASILTYSNVTFIKATLFAFFGVMRFIYWLLGFPLGYFFSLIYGKSVFINDLKMAITHLEKAAPGLNVIKDVDQARANLKDGLTLRINIDQAVSVRISKEVYDFFTRLFTVVRNLFFIPPLLLILFGTSWLQLGYAINVWEMFGSWSSILAFIGYLIHIFWVVFGFNVPDHAYFAHHFKGVESALSIDKGARGKQGRPATPMINYEAAMMARTKEVKSAPGLGRSLDVLLISYSSEVEDLQREESLRRLLSRHLNPGTTIIFSHHSEEILHGSGMAYLHARNRLKEFYPRLQNTNTGLPKDMSQARIAYLPLGGGKKSDLLSFVQGGDYRYLPIKFNGSALTTIELSLFNILRITQYLKSDHNRGAQILSPVDSAYFGPIEIHKSVTMIGTFVSMKQAVEQNLGVVFNPFGQTIIEFHHDPVMDRLRKVIREDPFFKDFLDPANLTSRQMNAITGLHVFTLPKEGDKTQLSRDEFDKFLDELYAAGQKYLQAHYDQTQRSIDLDLAFILVPLIGGGVNVPGFFNKLASEKVINIHTWEFFKARSRQAIFERARGMQFNEKGEAVVDEQGHLAFGAKNLGAEVASADLTSSAFSRLVGAKALEELVSAGVVNKVIPKEIYRADLVSASSKVSPYRIDSINRNHYFGVPGLFDPAKYAEVIGGGKMVTHIPIKTHGFWDYVTMVTDLDENPFRDKQILGVSGEELIKRFVDSEGNRIFPEGFNYLDAPLFPLGDINDGLSQLSWVKDVRKHSVLIDDNYVLAEGATIELPEKDLDSLKQRGWISIRQIFENINRVSWKDGAWDVSDLESTSQRIKTHTRGDGDPQAAVAENNFVEKPRNETRPRAEMRKNRYDQQATLGNGLKVISKSRINRILQKRLEKYDHALYRAIEKSVANAAYQKFNLASATNPNSAGYYVFEYNPANQSLEFLAELADRFNANNKLVLVVDDARSLPERAKIRSRLVKRFAADSRVLIPEFDQPEWAFETYVAKLRNELSIKDQDMIQLLAQWPGKKLDPVYLEAFYFGAIPLVESRIVIGGRSNSVAGAKRMTFEDIIATNLIAEKLVATSA